ncbi:hypothetical protein AB6D86_11980 [Vibrio splendidus]
MENTTNRTIKSPFRLDVPKLTRIVSLLNERFATLNPEYTCKFSYSTEKGRHFTGRSVNDVIEHDNPVDNPIDNLEIELFDRTEEPLNHVKLEFNRTDDQVKVRVDSESANFATELFDELEEQIARTQYHDKIKSIKESFYPILALLLIIVIPCVISYSAASFEYGFSEKLSKDDISSLIPVFESAVSQEDKVNAVFEMYRTLLENNNSLFSVNRTIEFIKALFVNTKFYAFVSSILIIMLLIKSLLKTSIGSAFYWGDFIEHVEVKEKQRSFLINILVGSVFLGVVVNTLFFSLT